MKKLILFVMILFVQVSFAQKYYIKDSLQTGIDAIRQHATDIVDLTDGLSAVNTNNANTYQQIINIINAFKQEMYDSLARHRLDFNSYSPIYPNAPVLTYSISGEDVTLDWDITDDSAQVWRSGISGAFQRIGSVTGARVTYTDATSVYSGNYYYYVINFNGTQQSSPSNTVNVSIPSGGGGVDQSRVFYFATNGSSSNLGTQASPYDMAKLNSTTWLPGDSLCLMYGNQWTRQTITFTESGTAGNPITLCAKGGAGNKPSLNGGTRLTGWTASGSQFRKLASNQGWLQFEVSFDSVVSGIPQTVLSNVDAAYEYMYSGGYYYVKDTVAAMYVTTTDGSILFSNTDYITIDGIDTRYYKDYNIYGNNIDHITVKNCTVKSIGNGYDDLGQGIMLQASRYGIIQDNNIKNAGEHGIYLPVFHDVSAQTAYDNLISGNFITNCYHTYIDVMNSYGLTSPVYTSLHSKIEVCYNWIQRDVHANPSVGAEGIQFQGRPTALNEGNNYIRNIKVHHNIINNIGNYNAIYPSWSIDSVYITNNTVYGGKGISMTDYNDQMKTAVVANNIVYLTGTNWQIWSDKRTAGIYVDHNLYYAANGSHFWALSDGISSSSLAAWRTATPFDDNSLYANPNWNSSTYQLNAGSGALNAGNNTYMYGTTDYYGNPLNGTVDIGAVERQ